MDTMTVEPALTAEEWAEMATDDGYGGPLVAVRDGELFTVDGEYGGGASGNTQTRPHAVMALANAVLPDPAKITRADVARCETAADRDEEAVHMMGGKTYRSDWRALADKLAALLPPE